MARFWIELQEALASAEYMLPEDASSMVATRLHEYRGFWRRIEADVAANLFYRDMMRRALEWRDKA